MGKRWKWKQLNFFDEDSADVIQESAKEDREGRILKEGSRSNSRKENEKRLRSRKKEKPESQQGEGLI